MLDLSAMREEFNITIPHKAISYIIIIGLIGMFISLISVICNIPTEFKKGIMPGLSNIDKNYKSTYESLENRIETRLESLESRDIEYLYIKIKGDRLHNPNLLFLNL